MMSKKPIIRGSFMHSIIYSVMLVFTCVIGDQLPKMGHVGPYISRHLFLRVAIDNFTHGIVAFLAWAVVVDLDLLSPDTTPSTVTYTPSTVTFLPSSGFVHNRGHVDAQRKKLLTCLLCMVLAMYVDVDHFIEARSFRLQNALHLSSRPVFHCTTLIPAIVIYVFFLSYLFHSRYTCHCFKLSLLFTTAWLSHHLRDANRHGLWLWPFGVTPPLPYAVYLGATVALAFAVRFCHTYAIATTGRCATESYLRKLQIV